jgi:uroporphyrinogen-III decarboxylase
VWIEDCLTDMISLQAFEKFNVPYVRRLAEEIRGAAMQSIHYFCGNPAGKWEALLSTGVDALSFEESKKGFVIDIEEVVQRVDGRCAVLGNLDAIGLLQDGSEAQLRAEVARQMRAGRRNGGRFVMSLGSPVTPGTSVERVRLYLDMAHEISAAMGQGSLIIQ